MNFHKTIGYLAALLLMVGIGVPDSFAQNTAKVTNVTPSSLREGQSRSVTVEVTLSAAPGTGNTTEVTVSLPSTFPTGSYLTAFHGEDSDNDGVPDTAGFPTIEISGTGKKGTAVATVTATEDNDTQTADTNYNHPRDKKVAFTLSFGGSGTWTAADGEMLAVREDDSPIQRNPLGLSIDPPSVNSGGSAQDVILTVTLEKAPGQDADNNDISKSIGVVATEVDGTTTISVTAVTIAGDDKSGETTVTVPANSVAGVVKVVASSVGYVDGEISIPVIERDANDVAGYRVLLTAPAANAWKGIGKKAVTVEVVRADKIAYSWTEFSSISVALVDTLVTYNHDNNGTTPEVPFPIYTLTASGFSKATGDLAFSRARLEYGATTATFGKNADANEITYNENADKLIFKFQTKAVTSTNVDDRLGTFPTGSDDRADEQAAGQRTAIYALVTFNNGGVVAGTLNNRSQKKITTTSDIAVGNGRLIKLDLMAPSADDRDDIFPSSPVVKIEGKTIKEDEEYTGKKGDVISVAVERSDKLLRSGKAQVVIQSIANEDAVGSAKSIALKTWTFTIEDVIDARGDSLRASIKVEDLNAQNTVYTADDRLDKDGQELEKAKKIKYEPDNLLMEARVILFDQANNKTGVTGNANATALSYQFRADPRAPVISVLHPTSDSPHFSGRNQNTSDEEAGIDFDAHLKPLELRADEELDSLFVYIKGAESERLNLQDEDAERDVVTKPFENRPTYFADTFGDTISYDTRGLKWKNAKGQAKSTGQGGRTVDLVIDAYDKVGNRTKMTLEGVHHDEVVPKIKDFFPKNELLEDDDNQINDATRHPVITLQEAVDSLSVTYDPSSGSDIVEVAENLAKGEHQVIITKPFTDGKTYTLTLFARDLAGNAYETDSNLAKDFKFDAEFKNPQANKFTVKNMNAAESDSVVAGQALHLEIQAVEEGATSADKDDRKALTYKSAASIRASDESVRFSGGGVTDNGDGTATLDADAWRLGKRTVYAKSNKAIDLLEVTVEQRNAGQGGTSVVAFNGSIDSLYVDAADFAGFEITAMEDGAEAQEVWGDFTLKVVPVDKFGNPSVKAYNGNPAKGSITDSLKVLDTRVDKKVAVDGVDVKNGFNYKNGFDITLRSLPDIGLPPFEWTIELAGENFPVTAPSNVKQVAIQIRIDNTSLVGQGQGDDGDTRSANIKTNTTIKVSAPQTITLSAADSDGNAVTDDVVIRSGESETVTVTASGVNSGDMVTFTVDGTADADAVKADKDGNATRDITMSEAGSVTVSASRGQYMSDDLTITFVVQAGRIAYTDADNMPVYLVSMDDMTVDGNDIVAFAAAFGTSEGDDNYNPQADVNDDGMVDIEDFITIVSSWGRTASGPSTKPLVLLPGINENAEFSLNLGSERVVAGELMAIDVSLANVEALMGYGFDLNYDATKFEFVSVAPADEDLLTSTGGEALFHHVVADGQVSVATGMYNGTAVSGGGDIVRFVFRVLYEFEDNARFEIADGLVFDPSQLSNPAVIAGVLELQSTPREFALHQNFPNPFNPDTTIKYDLAESADVTLQIYNVLGQVVRTLVASEAQNAGRYQIRWNGMDERGVPVSSGIYFYQIAADGKFSDVRKLMLLK